jgi:hypothetical protein
MLNRHDQAVIVPSPLCAVVVGDRVRIGLPEGPEVDFRLIRISSLVARTAAEVVGRGVDEPVIVSYGRASAEAREVLQVAGVSYVGEDGRVFLRAPGLFVERSEPLRRADSGGLRARELDALRNPFAKRSSRVPRWLLLHPTQAFSLGELADNVDLDPAAVSRVVRALEDSGHIEDDRSVATGRRRQVRVRSANALLDAWLPLWESRRMTQRRWDIGARDPQAAVALVAEALASQAGSWALGGLVGAAMVRRAVEPTETLVWTTLDGLSTLEELLVPGPARGGRGSLRVAVAPDPWTLRLADEIDGRPVADAVQLWLDCASGGERALEAADAVAQDAGWR